MKNNLLMILAIVALVVFPLYLHRHSKEDIFAGADDKASKVVESLNPGYKPWIEPLWNPPSGEIASMLFSLQAAAGAGVICYYLGYSYGRRRKD